MKQLQALEEWQAIRTVQPPIHNGLGIAARELQFTFSDYVYYNNLEDLRQELGIITTIDPLQTLPDEAIIGKSRFHLKKVLALLEELVNAHSVLQAPPSFVSENAFCENSTALPERIFGNYPTLKRLAYMVMTSEASSPLLRFGHSQSGRDVCERAAQTITEANKFLESISRHSGIPLDSQGAEIVAEAIHVEVDDRIHDFTSLILNDIQRQLSECQSRFIHDTLFTLPGRKDHGATVSDPRLDLLLRSCAELESGSELWQEATCHYIAPSTNLANSAYKPTQTRKNLCKTIEQHLKFNEHLHLKLENERVGHHHHSGGKVGLSETIICRSFSYLLDKSYFRPIDLSTANRFTPWEKRTLALQLSHIFLHTHDCKWTANRWAASEVQFTESRHGNAVKLPPYIKCNNNGTDVKQNQIPVFVALAKLLVEVEIGEEIKGQLIQYNKLNKPEMALTLSMILDSGRMSNTRYYSEAVEQCLRLAKGYEEPESMRNYILNNIVKNLEIELALMRKPQAGTPFKSNTKAMNATRDAPEARDFVSGPESPAQKLKNRNLSVDIVDYSTNPASTFETIFSPINTEVPEVHNAQLSITKSKKHRRVHFSDDLTEYSGIPNRKKQKLAIEKRPLHGNGLEDITDQEHRSNACGIRSDSLLRLFEDLEAHIPNEHKEKSAKEFFTHYERFKHTIPDTTDESPMPPKSGQLPRISVCVIDTGIDMNHSAIIAGKYTGAIKRDQCRSWIQPCHDINDNYGHGTHMVELILKSSMNVDIYVAKIANEAEVPAEDIGLIADAINHAIDVWDVDIITMSFGFAKRNEAVDEAVRKADYHGKLMFAAASNYGNNRGKTYPARHNKVISISASDGKGKDGGISPAPTRNEDNFMTLGISVPLLWKGKQVFRSGTSFATPIAVGFAINMMEICIHALGSKTVKDGEDMKRLLRLCSTRDNDYDYIAPWILSDGCKDFEHMANSIINALQ